MTDKEFNKSRRAILNYCERTNLATEVSESGCEVDFLSDFGMEAIDRDTLETPNCINTGRHIVVFLPNVCKPTESGFERSMNEYMNIAYGLMETAKPDYLMGVEKGVVKAVMYCVWE